MSYQVYKKTDVLVIGGGINGAGIARDLAGRGLAVMLCERDDLACATSSASTKLIHGGLRYLEHFEFGLVRSALKEREVLLKSAPHIIWPMDFILPHHKALRPRWLIRLGLFLYDHLGGRKILPASKSHNMTGTLLGQPLKNEFRFGFSYADCWVEDSRLVVLNALDAHEKGAEILTRAECVKLERHPSDEGWLVTLYDHVTAATFMVHTSMIVNATGPWVNKTLDLSGTLAPEHKVRWVKGSHIIVPRLYNGDHAYILQNEDKRIVFVIPYEREYSLIGTTDVDYQGGLDEVGIEIDEVEYLCAAVSKYFRHTVKPENVQWTYSGVRPLLDDGKGASAVTRDYVLDFTDYQGAPILSVYGGKITTFRKLAEAVGDQITRILDRGGRAWTEKASLPGGELVADFNAFYKTFRREFTWLPEKLMLRLARSYGTRARDILRGFKRVPDMGAHLGDDVYEAEVRYLVNVEWAMTAEDVLWRRSKLGLHVSEETENNIRRLIRHMQEQMGQEQVQA